MILKTKVVGMEAGGRQHIVADVSHHDPVFIVPEPDNPYDSNALAVYTAPMASIQHRDRLKSAQSLPPAGDIHPEDLEGLLERQAGYVPAALAKNLKVPVGGVVGYVGAVRTHPEGDDTPVGFDVFCEVEVRD